MLVDFMMIGAQKCGTTSLAEQLADHPQVCFSRKKEPGFFNELADWRAGLGEYHALFEPQPGQLCGEGSTMYTFLPEGAQTAVRLYEYNPDLKLIYIMRQPVKRIISHYAHNLVRGIEKMPPELAIAHDPTYINRSRYAVQIRPYLECFGPENVLLLFFEEYVADQIATLQQVASFLGIDAHRFVQADTEAKHQTTGRAYLKYESVRRIAETELFQSVRTKIPMALRQPLKRRLSNQIEQKPEFSPELRQLLWRFLEDDVRAIESMVNRQLTFWRNGYTQ